MTEGVFVKTKALLEKNMPVLEITKALLENTTPVLEITKGVLEVGKGSLKKVLGIS